MIIITNSDDGWVKYSCERYLPRLLPVIECYRVVSARTRYERFYANQPLCWKAAAFAHEVNDLYESYGAGDDDDEDDDEDWRESYASLTDVSSSSSDDSGSEGGDRSSSSASSRSTAGSPRKEILSFGDSMEERTAVRIVAEQLSATPKSVMFVTSPTPTQIIGQLQLVMDNMPFVCAHETSLDLEISPEQAERCATTFLKRTSHDTRQLHSARGDSDETFSRSRISVDVECATDDASY